MARRKISDMGGATINAVDIGGLIVPYFHVPAEDTKRIADNLPCFKFRDNDVMLCSYPKTGTNWTFEVISMVLNKSAEPVESIKDKTMLDSQSPEVVDKLPSPRVINCHYPYRFLPLEDMRAKQIKTIMCCRNPKDTAVSFYNQMKGVTSYEYDGKWSDWLPVYLQGKMEYGKYTDYLLEWEKAIQEGVGYPLHLIYYEDLKLNGLEELDKLFVFLGVNLEDQLKKDIIEMCSFDRMASRIFPEPGGVVSYKPGFGFFRKGQVGDWKNWLTVAQNELFEETWKREMKDSKIAKFAYTDRNV